jgi:sigma-E factor negative regulatory protein RseB
MRRGLCAWGWLALSLAAQSAWGQVLPGQQQEAMQWLQRVSGAARKLSYSGTFVYRNGSQSETSRIVHLAGSDGQMEKLEVLDGSPREVIRHNDEVRCYLPESQLVIVEQRSTRRAFPALLPASLAGLGESYVVRKAGNARIAGFESQIVRLEPRDAWRYGHQFWLDQETGLLLKADIFDGRGDSLESLAFTELRIGAPANAADAFKSSYSDKKGSWQVRQAKLRDMRDDAQWVFRGDLPGFRRHAAMLRSIPRNSGQETDEVMHWVFSDGIAALSVFISPLRGAGGQGEGGTQSLGAMSIMRRVIDNHQIVVMGDVPPAAVKHFAEGIGVRGK